MTARLRAVCALIAPCALLADIGCDHGYVARYALDHGVKEVIASDLAPGSLEKARRVLAPYGQRARLVCADGLAAIEGYRPDTIVLAGMGGKTVLEILGGYDGGATLILSPQRDVPAVRAYLTGHGREIVHDAVVCDRGRFYEVMSARPGIQRLDPWQLEFGAFCKTPDDTLREKLLREKRRLTAFGADTANISEVLKWQQR